MNEQQQASGEVPETVPVRVEVIRFLQGEGALDGLWFGERDEKERAFWWRKHLPAAHEPAPVDPLVEAIEAMRKTAQALRQGPNRDCHQVEQAIMWERRANAVEAELRARGVTVAKGVE